MVDQPTDQTKAASVGKQSSGSGLWTFGQCAWDCPEEEGDDSRCDVFVSKWDRFFKKKQGILQNRTWVRFIKELTQLKYKEL